MKPSGRGGHNRLLIELECHVCQIRWCPLGAKVAKRKTCSEQCRHEASALAQMDPMAPNSLHKHRRPGGFPKLSDIAAALGVSFLSMRGKLGGAARARALSDAQLRAIGKKAGKAASAYNRSPAGRERARRGVAMLNHKRWGTPLPEEVS